MDLTEFGERFAGHSGIVQLMDDLGKAMSENKDMLMLGGGNPSHIPEIQKIFSGRMQEILNNESEFNALIGNYDGPAGEVRFRSSLAAMLKAQFGWELSMDNICLTHGSQSGFFTLMNMFAGVKKDGSKRKVLLPLIPEYIGYSDQGLSDDFFVSIKPKIELQDNNTFKYRVDFDAIEMNEEIGAICVSRPTNPTGNVLTDKEIAHLERLAAENDVPLIIDNAYGLPFPDIIFVDAKPVWNENIILCMSLSKLGLPGARTGIIIARKEIVDAVSNINSILSLAPGSFGAALASELVVSGEIMRISREIVKPYYQEKSLKAIEWLHRELNGLDYYVHKSEGALFLWVWFKDLPVSSYELYERLKERNVLVVSGHYFYPGLDDENWPHSKECIRITYSMSEEVVEQAIKIIADEVRCIYTENK